MVTKKKKTNKQRTWHTVMQGKSKEKLFQRKNHNRTLFMTSRIHNSRMEALNTRISHILVLLSIVRFNHMTKRRSISIGLFYLSNLFSAWIFDEWLIQQQQDLHKDFFSWVMLYTQIILQVLFTNDMMSDHWLVKM